MDREKSPGKDWSGTREVFGGVQGAQQKEEYIMTWIQEKKLQTCHFQN
jgi:hypothetical protein